MSDNIKTIDMNRCTVPLCRNQQSCWYRRNGTCKFRHLQRLPARLSGSRLNNNGYQVPNHNCKTLSILVNGFAQGIVYNEIINIITLYIPVYDFYHLKKVPHKKNKFNCYINKKNYYKIYISEFDKSLTFKSFSFNEGNQYNKKYIICNRY